MLSYIGKGLSTTTNIKLKKFDYQNNQLTLEISAATSEEFSVFTRSLTQAGLSVKQENANLIGGRVNATLLIE